MKYNLSVGEVSPAAKLSLLRIMVSSSRREMLGCTRSSATGFAKDTDLLSRVDDTGTVEWSFLGKSLGLLVVSESVVYLELTEASSANSLFVSKCLKYSFRPESCASCG